MITFEYETDDSIFAQMFDGDKCLDPAVCIDVVEAVTALQDRIEALESDLAAVTRERDEAKYRPSIRCPYCDGRGYDIEEGCCGEVAQVGCRACGGNGTFAVDDLMELEKITCQFKRERDEALARVKEGLDA